MSHQSHSQTAHCWAWMCVCMAELWMHTDMTCGRRCWCSLLQKCMGVPPCHAFVHMGHPSVTHAKQTPVGFLFCFAFYLFLDHEKPHRLSASGLDFTAPSYPWPLSGFSLVSFSFCLSLRLSPLVLHLTSAPSHPSSCKRLWYFFCVFTCMFVCVRLYVHLCKQACGDQ